MTTNTSCGPLSLAPTDQGVVVHLLPLTSWAPTDQGVLVEWEPSWSSAPRLPLTTTGSHSPGSRRGPEAATGSLSPRVADTASHSPAVVFQWPPAPTHHDRLPLICSHSQRCKGCMPSCLISGKKNGHATCANGRGAWRQLTLGEESGTMEEELSNSPRRACDSPCM